VERHSLPYLARFFGLQQRGAHRALEDCRTLADLFGKLVEVAGAEGPEAFVRDAPLFGGCMGAFAAGPGPLVLFGIQSRTLGPYSAATHRTSFRRRSGAATRWDSRSLEWLR
jgi:DNA polymerase III epsilon subunit-like protein